MGWLLYGAGLRVLECCGLRVQDIDFAAKAFEDQIQSFVDHADRSGHEH
jgi:site-specific recombinase XerD